VSAASRSAPRRSLAAAVLAAAIRGYQRWISPALGPRCRFYPSCSEYAKTAIEVHGATRGTWLTIRRLVKCQPFHPGGFDYVPPPKHASERSDAVRDRVAEPPKGTTQRV
jgi:putative membrane protein insertion efficiency factor